MRRRIGLALAASLVVLAGCSKEGAAPVGPPPAPAAVPFEGMTTPQGPRPQSVVLVIADGTGPQQLALLMDWADAARQAPTAFERLAGVGTLGMVRTGASDSPLTDSASSATAMASGVESYNGAIGVDTARQPVRTCLEDAAASGRRTGLVTTTTLTHATPAAFAAHIENRSKEQAIGEQMLASRVVDVLLGGGRRFLTPEAGRAAGYAVATTGEELAAIAPGTPKVLGVFHDSHIPYAIDRDGPDEPRAPSLADMTRDALRRLDGPDGFFLMVEAGRVDHGGHINDVAAVLGELREFDDTIAVLLEFRATHPDTLVVVTADHETGGLAISSGGMPLRPAHFVAMGGVGQSLEAIAQATPDKEKVDPAVYGVGRRNFYPPYSWWETSRALARSAEFDVSYATQGHTTTPVVCVAAGPGQEHFVGLYRNEHIGRMMRFFMLNQAQGAQ